MSSRRNAFQKGNFYHVYNRGKRLFYTVENYRYCVSLLKKYASKFQINVCAYCLMPNHFHLLIKQEGEYPVSKLIAVVFNQYVQSLNHQIGQKGTIFEGKFKHIFIDKDEYLLELCRYIHLNPVKAHLVVDPKDWVGSDYSDWVTPTSDNLILNAYFGGINNYSEFVMHHLEERLPKRYLF